jgi:hypothetical protein
LCDYRRCARRGASRGRAKNVITSSYRTATRGRVKNSPAASVANILRLSLDSNSRCSLCADARSIRGQKLRCGISAKQYQVCQADHFDGADIDIQADADFFAQRVQDWCRVI